MAIEGRYLLAALDMDGTLLNTRHEATDYTRAVIRRAAEAGGIVALSTGRCMSELRGALAALEGVRYVIGENGACVYDICRDETIRRIAIDEATVSGIFEAASGLRVLPQCFVDGQSYMQCGDEADLEPFHIRDFAGVFREGSIFVDDVAGLCCAHPGRVGKVNLYFADHSQREAFRVYADGLRVALADSIGLGFELSPQEVTKASGLRMLCEYIGLPIERAMVVGDGSNDVDIMSAAGLPVAMGNAIDAVRRLAKVVTEDCDHDGAANAIRRYMLGEEI